MKSPHNQDLITLLTELPVEPPKGYHYEVEEYRRNIVSFWLCGGPTYLYNGGHSARTIHSFYDFKKKKWYAPINSKKIGAEVDPASIRPWTAIPLSLNPLMAAFI